MKSVVLTWYTADENGVGPESGSMSEGWTDCPVPLGRDGYHHKDAGGDEDALEGVKEVGETDSVPQWLRLALRPDKGPHQTHVNHIIQQQQCIHDSCNRTCKNVTS